MRKLIIIVGVAATVLALGAPAAEAQRSGGPGGRGPGIGAPGRPGGGPMNRLRALRRLDLSAEQKAQVKDIAASTRSEAAPLLKQLREQRQAVRAAIEAGTPAETARAEARATLGGLRQQLQDIRQKTRAAIRGVLTPEQIDRLQARRRGHVTT